MAAGLIVILRVEIQLAFLTKHALAHLGEEIGLLPLQVMLYEFWLTEVRLRRGRSYSLRQHNA